MSYKVQNPKNLDLSYKTDLDFWVVLEEKTVLKLIINMIDIENCIMKIYCCFFYRGNPC